MEKVTVLIVSYNRESILKKSLYGFLKNVQYPRDLLEFHLADDKSPGNLVENILNEFKTLKWTYTITERRGWGANVNAALKAIKNDCVFLMEDDRCAYDKINLNDGVRLLRERPEVGLVRYDGIAGHVGLVLQLKEFGNEYPRTSFLTVDKVATQQNYIYSNQPHLRHRRFTEAYGYYPEGLKLGQTEVQYAGNFRAKKGPDIAILEDGIINKFEHLGAGKSWQHTNEDVGK